VSRGIEVSKPVVVLEWPEPGDSLLAGVLGDLADRVEIDPFRRYSTQSLDEICRDATIVCFHIDLTLRRGLPLNIADLSDRLREQGRFVVNGYVQDISKESLARHLRSIQLPTCIATELGPANEELFVKTNLNYGGRKEKNLPPEIVESSRLGELIAPDIGPYSYKVLARKEIPPTLWTDRAHFIEKFVSNVEGTFIRTYFSGVQIIIVVAYAPGAIKKLVGDPRDTNYVTDIAHLKSGAEDFLISDSLKSLICSFVEMTPVEFGCIDIVHDDFDHYYIVDLNTTPSGGVGTDAELNGYLQLGITEAAYRKTWGWLDSPLIRSRAVGQGQ
jgi:hypothetical protein